MEGMKKAAVLGFRGLRQYYFYFGAASVVCLVVLTTGALLSNYTNSLRQTVAMLETRRAEAAKIDSSLKSLKRSMSETRAAVPTAVWKESSERSVLISLDRIKSVAPYDTLTVGELQTKENETILPFTLKGTLGDYPGFLVMLGRLQAMRFPFVVMDEVRLMPGQGGGTAEAVYEIKGVLKTPDSALFVAGKGE
jgi:hypothetical protein